MCTSPKGASLFVISGTPYSLLVKFPMPYQIDLQQECIPVGCVPPAAVAVCLGEGVSASVHAGIHLILAVDLETPIPGVGLETPSGCGPGIPPWPDTPNLPAGSRPGIPPSQNANLPLGLGLDTPCGQNS